MLKENLKKVKGFISKHNKLFKILSSVVILFFVYKIVNTNNLISSMTNINIGFFLIAIGIQILSNLFGALSWHFCIQSGASKTKFLDVLSSYYKGLFFNNILPSNIGGDVIRGYSIIDKYRQSRFYIASILIDRIFNFLVLIWIGLISISIYMKLIFLASLIIIVPILSVVLSVRFRYNLISFLFTLLKKTKNRFLINLIFLYSRLSKKFNLLISFFLFAVLNQVFKILTIFAVVYSLRSLINPFYFFFIVPVWGTVSLIPASIGGLGPRELSSHFFETLPGVDYTSLVAISILGYFVLLLACSLGAFFLIFDKKKKG